MRFSPPWQRSGLASLLMVVLLLTATLTGACEARCAVARVLPGAACHAGGEQHNMPGMGMAAHAEISPMPMVSVAVEAPPSCLHHGVVSQPALLPAMPTLPLPPALETLISYLRLSMEPMTGPARYDDWLQDRSERTPIARRTTLRL